LLLPSHDDYPDRSGYRQACLQVHGVDENEQSILRRQLRRSEMGKFFGKLAPTRVGLEACGASHY
jgi:transposase